MAERGRLAHALSAPCCWAASCTSAATLAVPLVGSGNAFGRLRDTLPAQPHGGPAAAGARQAALPFLPPDALYAMCRYELTAAS